MVKKSHHRVTPTNIRWDNHFGEHASEGLAEPTSTPPPLQITIHADHKSSWQVAASEATVADGLITFTGLPTMTVDVVQVIDLNDSTWAPISVEVKPVCAQVDNLPESLVGQHCKAGANLTGTLLNMTEKQLVILDADGQMHVTPRLSVVVDSNVATHTVVAKYDASKVDEEKFAPTLVFSLKPREVYALAKYDVELDRKDAHAVLKGQWIVHNQTGVDIKNARICVEQASPRPERQFPKERNSKFSSFKSNSGNKKVKSSAPHVPKNRRRSSSSFNSNALHLTDEEKSGQDFRFLISNQLNVGAYGTAAVSFCAESAPCSANIVVDFADAESFAGAVGGSDYTNRGVCDFRVEFGVQASALGALPGGDVTLWRAAKGGTRRLCVVESDLKIAIGHTPRWISLTTSFLNNVLSASRTVEAVVVDEANNDANQVRYVRQKVLLTINNSGVQSDTSIIVVDPLLTNQYDLSDKTEKTVKVTCETPDPTGYGQITSHAKFQVEPHPFFTNRRIIRADLSEIDEKLFIGQTVVYDLPEDAQTNASSDDEPDTAAPATDDNSGDTPSQGSTSSGGRASNSRRKAKREVTHQKSGKKGVFSFW